MQIVLSIPKKLGHREAPRPALVRLDVHGALDSMVHQKVPLIISHFKFPSFIIVWLKCFLNDRTYNLRFDNQTSPA